MIARRGASSFLSTCQASMPSPAHTTSYNCLRSAPSRRSLETSSSSATRILIQHRLRVRRHHSPTRHFLLLLTQKIEREGVRAALRATASERNGVHQSHERFTVEARRLYSTGILA